MQISGPVSLRVFRDGKSDRNFYVFGDVHYSLDGSCSQQDKSLKCNRPSYDYSSSIKTGTNCWTISSLINDVLERHGDGKIRTDFYIEASMSDEDHNSFLLREYAARKVFGPPKNARELAAAKERMESVGFGWIDDIFSTLHKKNYGDSVKVIKADARSYNDCLVTPFVIPDMQSELMFKLKQAVGRYFGNRNESEYRYSMKGVLDSIQDVLSLSEQLVADPYEFLEHLFVPKDFAHETRTRIEYIPTESEATKEMVKELYKAIDKKYGFRRKDGIVVAHSAAAWARLKAVNEEMAMKIDDFTKQHLMNESMEYIGELQFLSETMQGVDLTDPQELDILSQLIPIIEKTFVHSVIIGAIVMDRYVLSETFRSNAKHNIYFIGDAHAKNYSSFFEGLGFDLIEKIESSGHEDRCITSTTIGKLLF